MASNSVIGFEKVESLYISEMIENRYQQIQLECKNGRRFILKGLRTNVLEKLQTAMEIIKSDQEINLAEWVEVAPKENSEAHKALNKRQK